MGQARVHKVMYLLVRGAGSGYDVNLLLRTSADDAGDVYPGWATAAVLQDAVAGLPKGLVQTSMLPIGSALYVLSCHAQEPVLARLTGTASPRTLATGVQVDTSGLPPCGGTAALGSVITSNATAIALMSSLEGSGGLPPLPPGFSTPIRLVYTGLDAQGFQVVHVEDVAVSSGVSPTVTILGHRTLDASARGHDIGFPDIIWPEGRKPATTAPQVLH